MSEKDRKLLGLDFDPKPLGTYTHEELAFCLTVLQQYRYGTIESLPVRENVLMCPTHLFEAVIYELSDINEWLMCMGSWTPPDRALIDVKWVHFYLSTEFDTECSVVPARGKDQIVVGILPN